MDAAARTRELDRALLGVGWSFWALLFFSQLPFAPLIVGPFLAYELRNCAVASPVRVARPLILTAALVLPWPVFHTVALFTDVRWLIAGVPFLAAALYAGVHGFAMIAEWFGGMERWRRARHEAAAAAGALCLVAGLALSRPGARQNPLNFGEGDSLPVMVAAGAAIVVVTYGVFRVTVAFRDLRIRVRAAIAADEREDTLAAHG